MTPCSPEKSQKKFTEMVRDELKFLDYAPLVFLSAKTGAGVKRLFPIIQECYDSASKRVTTGELNRFVETLNFGPDMKVYYITQASLRPPTFVMFTNKVRNLHFSMERFMVNRLRQAFGFKGTPVIVKTKSRHGERR